MDLFHVGRGEHAVELGAKVDGEGEGGEDLGGGEGDAHCVDGCVGCGLVVGSEMDAGGGYMGSHDVWIRVMDFGESEQYFPAIASRNRCV